MQLTRDEITRLSPEERLRLIEQRWDSPEDEDVPPPPVQEADLERRRAPFDRDGVDAVTRDTLTGPRWWGDR